MKVKLLKDWGDHLKDSEIEVTDNSVLSKGNKIGLFKLTKEQLATLETKEEDSEIEVTDN